MRDLLALSIFFEEGLQSGMNSSKRLKILLWTACTSPYITRTTGAAVVTSTKTRATNQAIGSREGNGERHNLYHCGLLAKHTHIDTVHCPPKNEVVLEPAVNLRADPGAQAHTDSLPHDAQKIAS